MKTLNHYERQLNAQLSINELNARIDYLLSWKQLPNHNRLSIACAIREVRFQIAELKRLL